MRHGRRPAAGAGLAAMVVSGLVTLATGPAQAGTPPGSAGAVAHGTGVETEADAEEVRDFWTPRRRAQAVPRSVELDPAPGAPEASARKAWRKRTSKGGVWKRGGDVVSTNGVLFFVLQNAYYTCSASLVSSRNESTVVTAGHCLHTGEGVTEDNVASYVEFVPGTPGRNGRGTFTGPSETWVATEIVVTEEWAAEGDTDYDIGMIEVREQDGQTLQQTVGAAPGIKFFDEVPAEPAPVHAFGYPTNRPFAGDELAYCAGPPRQRPKRETQALRLACTMGAGSSGGPWLQGYGRRHNGGLGRMVAVTSFGYVDDEKGIYGPYFQDEARAVFRAVQRDPAP